MSVDTNYIKELAGSAVDRCRERIKNGEKSKPLERNIYFRNRL